MVWISGASGGIGQALCRTVPWADARIIGINRKAAQGIANLEVDLTDPASWPLVGESFQKEMANFQGDRIVFVHAAGTVIPLGFAGEVSDEDYSQNVILNSASPQVLGHLFLRAVRNLSVPRYLIILTSGAARSIYPGWASYGAGKAAVDQWVRDVGAEQSSRGGVQVLSVTPGTVDTEMQAQLRAAQEEDFPKRQKFLDVERDGKLTPPDQVARKMWKLLEADLENGSVLDLRELPD